MRILDYSKCFADRTAITIARREDVMCDWEKLRGDRNWFFTDTSDPGHEKPDDHVAIIYIPKMMQLMTAWSNGTYQNNVKI